MEGGSDRLHELTVRYKAAQASAGSGEGPWASGQLICGAAGKGRRTQSLAPRSEGTWGLATLPPFPRRYELSEAISLQERSNEALCLRKGAPTPTPLCFVRGEEAGWNPYPAVKVRWNGTQPNSSVSVYYLGWPCRSPRGLGLSFSIPFPRGKMKIGYPEILSHCGSARRISPHIFYYCSLWWNMLRLSNDVFRHFQG